MRNAFSNIIDNYFWVTVFTIFAAAMLGLLLMGRPAHAQTQCYTSCIYVGDTPYCTTTCY